MKKTLTKEQFVERAYTIKENNFKNYIRKICRELKITVCQFDF